jgi:hypothetical protein
VSGKSPLEYLTPAERIRQRDAVVALMKKNSSRVSELIDEFIRRIETYA